MNPRSTLASLVLLATLTSLYAQRAKDENKPLLYNDITEGTPAFNREAEKTYAAKFRIVETTPKDGFSPSGYKGLYKAIFHDPRSMRDYAIPGSISFTYILTPQGRTTEIRVLHSTDERVSKYIVDRVTYERYFPARFHGVPVHCLCGDEIKFGGPDTSSRQSGDGLGVYHSRDR